MRLGPPPEAEEEPGQFWKDFIRETAPVFRADDRAARGVHRADLPGADRRRALRRRPAARDLRRARARRDRRGQRRARSRRCRRAGARGCGSCPATRPRSRTRRPAASSPATPPADRAGWDEFRDEYARTHARPARGLRRVLPRARRARAARPRVHPRLAVPEPLPLSGRGRLRARARRSTARGTTCRPASARPTRRGRLPEALERRRPARLPEPRLARLRRRRADAAR